MKSFYSNLFKNILLIFASLIFILLLFEIFLRLFMPQIFEIHPPGLYMENQAVGYTHTPYYEGYIEREEFKNYIR